MPLSPATFTSVVLCAMGSNLGLRLPAPNPENENAALHILWITLQQHSAENPKERKVIFPLVTARWFFRTYMAEGTSDQLRRRLGELLQRRPTHSDNSWKDSMMKANRIKALVDCHKVALRRKKALGFSLKIYWLGL